MKLKMRVIPLILFLLISGHGFGQSAPNWMRYPSISPDGKTIVFTYKGDLYTVPSTGGDAKQITFHEAHDYKAIWSPDGSKIAFASDRYGNFDIFIMEAEGGPATRLTYHSNDESPYEFSNDGNKVIFGAVRMDIAAHRQYPTGYQPELYSVPANGGRVDQVWTIPAENVFSNSDGSKMLYHDKKGGENEWRKHHESGVARDIWIFDRASNSHKMLTSFYGEDRNPVFSPDESEVFYLSEASGSFNVFSLSLADPSQTTALTHYDKFPVRFLSISKDGLLSFGYDGELYTLRKGEDPKKLDISLRTQSIANSDNFIEINGGVREMSISPNGKEIAFIARGEVFVTSVDGSLTKRITNTPEQERFVEFAPDGKSVIYSSEREGKWKIFQAKKLRDEEPFFFASTLLEETPLLSLETDVYLPKFSPDGKKLAYIEGRRTLKVLNLADQSTVTLMTPEELFHMSDGDQYFTWSPDSKWLLATYRPTMVNSEVVLLDASGKEKMRKITQSGYSDDRPVWVNQGKQMLWFSNRDGLKSYATSGRSEDDVYMLFFEKAAWDKFRLTKEEFDLLKEIEESGKKEEGKKDEKKEDKDKVIEPIKFDWDGIEDRKARLTIHSSLLGDAVLSKDGEKLYYLARFEKGLNLWSTNLRTKETKQEISLNANSGRLAWDKDQKNLFLLSDGNISKINPESMKRESIKIAGEMSFDREAEVAHLFEHVWLRTKGIFYTPTMHGIDWDRIKVDYAKYLPHIGNNYEFSELLSEMIGELNVSHAGARYSRSIPLADATASLGIFWDYGYQGNGLKIDEIISGGPLDKADLDIKSGMIIEKIDGELIDPSLDFAKLLNRKEGKFTLLEVMDPKTNTRKQVTIKPISLTEENRLLYKRWVKQNQAEVEKLSGGKLGYVHIPGMSDGPYRNVFEEMMGKYHDMEGVIVDTRFNGGGDLVADLAMFFTGERFLTYATEAKEVGYEPTARWTKPTLAMFNEANYSDGHCFACGYTDLKIGKTVGMPTPGTCSYAGWEGLPNGIRWGAVPISAKNMAGEWLENNETRPQFEVKNMPGMIDKGRDQQLEKAVEELMKELN
ncbi:S41 family peptidase [Algoriphagus sp. CAU 1675]|uniref:S41 family peptidase n=1 Tax=Algoriphagus sp. CAU 1675 TaxID=3032597 RepID=UPI0023D9EB6A|nr:S41 family peptidase [Algoriphagus sp. CAU 1675]MDF2157748.1 S41 family peptidase [Algoriphagus sp. CAU 1675]